MKELLLLSFYSTRIVNCIINLYHELKRVDYNIRLLIEFIAYQIADGIIFYSAIVFECLR